MKFILMIVPLLLTGCANPIMQTSNETVTNKPPPELLGLYAVPFR